MHVGSDRSVRQVLAAPRVKLQMQEGEGFAPGTIPFLRLQLDARRRKHLAHRPI